MASSAGNVLQGSLGLKMWVIELKVRGGPWSYGWAAMKVFFRWLPSRQLVGSWPHKPLGYERLKSQQQGQPMTGSQKCQAFLKASQVILTATLRVLATVDSHFADGEAEAGSFVQALMMGSLAPGSLLSFPASYHL